MDAWKANPGLPSELPQNLNDNDNDNDDHVPRPFPTSGPAENLKNLPVSTSTKAPPLSNIANTFKLTLPHANLDKSAAVTVHTPTATATANTADGAADTDAVVAVLAHSKPESTSGEAWTGPSCLQNYLVLGRLFKLHPDFDAAIEGILVRDTGGCVVLIHETTDEEWTRVVWTRLREVLAPRGMHMSTKSWRIVLAVSGPREGATFLPETATAEWNSLLKLYRGAPGTLLGFYSSKLRSYSQTTRMMCYRLLVLQQR